MTVSGNCASTQRGDLPNIVAFCHKHNLPLEEGLEDLAKEQASKPDIEMHKGGIRLYRGPGESLPDDILQSDSGSWTLIPGAEAQKVVSWARKVGKKIAPEVEEYARSQFRREVENHSLGTALSAAPSNTWFCILLRSVGACYRTHCVPGGPWRARSLWQASPRARCGTMPARSTPVRTSPSSSCRVRRPSRPPMRCAAPTWSRMPRLLPVREIVISDDPREEQDTSSSDAPAIGPITVVEYPMPPAPARGPARLVAAASRDGPLDHR